MKYVHRRPPGPDAGGLPGGWDTHNGLAEPYFTLSQRHRGKSHGPASVLRPGGGEANHLLRHGPHSAGGKPGVFLQPIGPAFPRPFGLLPALLWKCLRGGQPQGKGADEPDGGVLPGTGDLHGFTGKLSFFAGISK